MLPDIRPDIYQDGLLACSHVQKAFANSDAMSEGVVYMGMSWHIRDNIRTR